MSQLNLALCKHPEHSWCLCWVDDSPWLCGTTRSLYMFTPFDPLNPKQPDRNGAIPVEIPPGHYVHADQLNKQLDMCCLIGRTLVYDYYNGMKGIRRVSGLMCTPDGVQTLDLLRNGGQTATWILSDPFYARVLEADNFVRFNSGSHSAAVDICPHLIHLPPAVPKDLLGEPYWWDRVQKAHAGFLDTYKGPKGVGG